MIPYDEPSEDTIELLASATAMLAGASQAELIITLYRTLKVFCNDSNAWIDYLPIMVVPNKLDYPVQPITGKIIRLQNVIDQNNVPQAAAMPELDVVHLAYPYNQVQPMTVIVSKAVTNPFRDGRPFPPYFPDHFYRKYGTGILDGVVGRMMMEAGQSYSDPQKGVMHMGQFRTTVALARVEAMRMNLLGGQSWAYPQQFRVTSQRGGVSTFNMNPSPITAR